MVVFSFIWSYCGVDTALLCAVVCCGGCTGGCAGGCAGGCTGGCAGVCYWDVPLQAVRAGLQRRVTDTQEQAETARYERDMCEERLRSLLDEQVSCNSNRDSNSNRDCGFNRCVLDLCRDIIQLVGGAAFSLPMSFLRVCHNCSALANSTLHSTALDIHTLGCTPPDVYTLS